MNLRLSLGLGFVLATGCFSSGRYQREVERNAGLVQRISLEAERTAGLVLRISALERENERLRIDINEAAVRTRGAQSDARACEAKLAEIDRVQKAELLQEVAGLNAQIPIVEENGYLQGQLRLWQSLRIQGTPREEPHFFSTSYFYRFELSLGGRVFHSQEIQTERRIGRVARAFADILKVAEVALRIPRIPK